MKPETPIELPPKYYLDNFNSLVEFVQKMYGNILEEAEQQFITQFYTLPEDGQCLYLRMMNRRKRFFRINKFSYPELEITPQLWQGLFRLGFALPVGEITSDSFVDYFAEIAELFTKPELTKIGRKLGDLPKGFSQRSKAEVVFYFQEEVSFEDFLEAIAQSGEEIVAQGSVEVTEFLLFLYFGNLYKGMSEFVIRDLGNARYEEFEDEEFTPYFQSRKDADDKFSIAQIYRQFRVLREIAEPQAVFEAFHGWLPQRESLSNLALSTYDKLVLRLADWLEKQKLPEQALKIYEYSPKPPSGERQVRIWHKLGNTEQALSVCQSIEAEPQNADEKYFAIDFRNRLEKKRIKSTTAFLKKADEVVIPVQFKHQVEQGVLQHYLEQGWLGFHSENTIWRGFFGVFFWDIIFETEAKSVHNPFQRIPSDLYQPEFYTKRESSILDRLAILEDKEASKNLLQQNFERKFGIFNPLTGWHTGLLEGMMLYLQLLEPLQLQATLHKIAKNVREHTKGLPDLFVYNDGEYQFIEVKSPTDSLSAQQLDWLHFFQQIGVKAKALKVVWGEEEA